MGPLFLAHVTGPQVGGPIEFLALVTGPFGPNGPTFRAHNTTLLDSPARVEDSSARVVSDFSYNDDKKS